MTINEIKQKLNTKEYDFLRENEHLGSNIILLGLGGSYAYGTNTESSDLDIRGVALKRKHEILTPQNFEQFINEETDTTIYSFDKICSLLLNCNPNVIELLGLKPEHYLYLSSVGQELLDNSHLFLSKKAVGSFKGYATAQFRRLENKAARVLEQSENEAHILETIEGAYDKIREHYFDYPDDAMRLYIDKAVTEGYITEIFIDANFKHYPLRDFKGLWNELHSIVKSYGRIGKRNQHAIEHNKLGKHMMHLLRLYMMCLDILEKQQIITYREDEHDLLMDIRDGKYLKSDSQPTDEFFELLEDYKKKLEYAEKHSELQDKPNYKEVNDFIYSVNERIVKGVIK